MSEYKIKVFLFFIALVSIIFNFSAKKSGLNPTNNLMFSSAQWMGKYPPDFHLELLDGGEFLLSDNIGKKIIIVNFFATWCLPCKREMPELNAYYKKHKGENIIMIGIEQGSDLKKVKEFVKENKVDFPIGIDKGMEIQELYKIYSYPVTIFIGFDGRIKLYQEGEITNADIAFDNIYKEELNHQKYRISKKEYYEKLKIQGEGKIIATETSLMSERARRIGKQMNCLCGCDHNVIECECSLAKKIRKELAAMKYDDKISDDEIIRNLNKKYCKK